MSKPTARQRDRSGAPKPRHVDEIQTVSSRLVAWIGANPDASFGEMSEQLDLLLRDHGALEEVRLFLTMKMIEVVLTGVADADLRDSVFSEVGDALGFDIRDRRTN